MEDAIHRAAGLVRQSRICTIVAQQHRRWWSDTPGIADLPARNVIVQPRNRGTGIGVLYSLTHLLAHDPRARVVLLPADHYVREEPVLREALRMALHRVERKPDAPVLLGLQPDETDTELGYILPGRDDGGSAHTVARFIEKPRLAVASEIISAGALWNTFIIATAAHSLLNLFLPRFAALVMEMQVIVSKALQSQSPTAGWPAITDMYERLPDLDFSRDVLQGNEASLCVMAVPECGWSDLGTPHRVAQTLRRIPVTAHRASAAHVNLAAQYAQRAAVRANGG